MSGVSTVAIGLILCLVPGSAAAAQAQGAVKSSEWGLRSRAKASPMPAYPRESLAEKISGVAVAAVLFGVDGKLASIDILEAPDEHMAAAVRDAVERWNVPGAQVMGRDERSPIQGKLTFYFQVRNGKGVVLDPDEMPGGSPRPQPRATSSSPPPGPPPVGPPPAGSPTSSAPDAAKTITVEEFKKLSLEIVVVDVGERDAFKRGHWPGAVNIPADEMSIRGGIELPRDKTIVIDCTQEQKFYCDVAAAVLARQKFSNVMLLVR
jgi:rhodanese-related sulfurtransferase